MFSAITPTGEIPFTTTEGDEAEQLHSLMPDAPKTPQTQAKGEMRCAQKTYTVTPKAETPKTNQLRSYVQSSGVKNSVRASTPSPMSLVTSMATSTSRQAAAKSFQPAPKVSSTTPQTATPTAKHSFQKAQTPTISKAQASPALPKSAATKRPITPTTQTRGQPRTTLERKESRNHSTPIQSRKWGKQETEQWWQQRYHEKERDGQREGRRDQEHNEELSGVGSSTARKSLSTENGTIQKPILERPKTGVFALYYILTKMGIQSDGTSNFFSKKEIESVDAETTEAHKKRLVEMKTSIEKQRASDNWALASQIYSWIGSIVGIAGGVALIATGVGTVAGAMLIVGGLIQITNQLLQITGSWNKIAEMLPGNDLEKKRAVINWIQIGIAVLCLILAGVGSVWGGVWQVQESMQKVLGAIVGIGMMGKGATTIGQGVYGFMYHEKMSEVKRYDKVLARLKHRRQDLMERVEWSVDRLEQLFEDLAKALEFEVELFRADQMINR